jgi:hypothetical protein
MKKILLCAFLSILAGCGNQVRQDQLDYDKMRLEMFKQNQIEKNKIAAIDAQAKAEAAKVLADTIKAVCLVDGNPGLCVNSSLDKMQTVTAPAVVQAEPMPQQTPVPQNRGWQYAAQFGLKILDVGLGWHGIDESNNTARYGIAANKDLILGLTDNIGRNAGTHLGDGSNFYNGNYNPNNSDNSDHSVDNSVSVGGDQNIAGRDVINGQVGDDVGGNQTLVGRDQLSAGGDLAVGDANFNNGRIGSDGPFVECQSGNTGAGTGGNGSTGTGATGGAVGAPGTGLLNCNGGG